MSALPPAHRLRRSICGQHARRGLHGAGLPGQDPTKSASPAAFSVDVRAAQPARPRADDAHALAAGRARSQNHSGKRRWLQGAACFASRRQERDSPRAKIQERLSGCVICEQLDGALNRYAYTIAQLYGTNAEFKQMLDASKGLLPAASGARAGYGAKNASPAAQADAFSKRRRRRGGC